MVILSYRKLAAWWWLCGFPNMKICGNILWMGGMETGVENPMLSTIKGIADALGVSVEAGNMAKVLAICEQVHKEGHIPVAPYLVSLQYLNDEVVEDRELGVEANLVCFHRGFVDELWLYGDKISEGMKREIALAKELKIPVVAKTEGTKKDLEVLNVLK